MGSIEEVYMGVYFTLVAVCVCADQNTGEKLRLRNTIMYPTVFLLCQQNTSHNIGKPPTQQSSS